MLTGIDTLREKRRQPLLQMDKNSTLHNSYVHWDCPSAVVASHWVKGLVVRDLVAFQMGSAPFFHWNSLFHKAAAERRLVHLQLVSKWCIQCSRLLESISLTRSLSQLLSLSLPELAVKLPFSSSVYTIFYLYAHCTPSTGIASSCLLAQSSSVTGISPALNSH